MGALSTNGQTTMSPDGNWVAVCDNNTTPALMKWNGSTYVNTAFNSGGGTVLHMAWTPDMAYLVVLTTTLIRLIAFNTNTGTGTVYNTVASPPAGTIKHWYDDVFVVVNTQSTSGNALQVFSIDRGANTIARFGQYSLGSTGGIRLVSFDTLASPRIILVDYWNASGNHIRNLTIDGAGVLTLGPANTVNNNATRTTTTAIMASKAGNAWYRVAPAGASYCRYGGIDGGGGIGLDGNYPGALGVANASMCAFMFDDTAVFHGTNTAPFDVYNERNKTTGAITENTLDIQPIETADAFAFARLTRPSGVISCSKTTPVRWAMVTNNLNPGVVVYEEKETGPIIDIGGLAPAHDGWMVTAAMESVSIVGDAPAHNGWLDLVVNVTMDAIGEAPARDGFAELEQNATITAIGTNPPVFGEMLAVLNDEVPKVRVAPPVSVMVMDSVYPVTQAQVLPRPYIKASFGALQSAASVKYHMDTSIGAGFGALAAELSGAPDPNPVIAVGFSALYSASFAAGDPAPVIALGFQPLYSAGLLAEPVKINFQMGFGALAADIGTDKPNMNVDLAVGFQPLYSAAILDNPIAVFAGGAFGALQTTAIASGPVFVEMTPGFQKLQSDAMVFVPIFATVEAGFQRLATFVDVLIPNVVRLSPGFRPLETFVDIMVPTVARLSPGFAALESDGFTMVPNTIRLAPGFAALESDGFTMVPNTLRMSPGFQRLASAGYVMVPQVARMHMGFSPMTTAMFGASTFSTDVRTVFGRLGMKMVVSPPVKLNGNVVLPFMDTEGQIAIDYYAEGDFALPFADVSGAVVVSYLLAGEAVLPAVDVSGQLSVFNVAAGDFELPGLDVSGSVMIVYRLSGEAVLPYLEVVGRGTDAGLSPVGNAPTLMGAGTPYSMLRTGGGVFLNFDIIAIG